MQCLIAIIIEMMISLTPPPTVCTVEPRLAFLTINVWYRARQNITISFSTMPPDSKSLLVRMVVTALSLS